MSHGATRCRPRERAPFGVIAGRPAATEWPRPPKDRSALMLSSRLRGRSAAWSTRNITRSLWWVAVMPPVAAAEAGDDEGDAFLAYGRSWFC